MVRQEVPGASIDAAVVSTGQQEAWERVLAELEVQREAMAELQAQVAALRACQTDARPSRAGKQESDEQGKTGCGGSRISRGGLLKGAAAGIAGLAAAELASTMGATPAAADNIPGSNFEANGGSGSAFYIFAGSYDTGFDAISYYTPNVSGVNAAGGQVGVKGTGPTGVQGVSNAASNSGVGTGVDAIGGDVGLSASGDTYGITATTNGTTGYAVYATTSQGYGIYADSTNATGVWAHGGSFGVDADSANGFGVHGNSDNNTGVGGVGGIYGVWGKSTTASGVGVYGECPANIAVYGVSTNNTGVWGQGGATGVTGVCDSTYGVHGESKNGFGVWGHSDNSYGVGGVGGVYGVWGKNVSTGIGVYGENDSTGSGVTGVSTGGLGGVFTGGRAPLLLTPAGAAGPPTSGSHARGEVYVDSNGLLFSCTASGTPGSWRKLSSTVPIPTVRVLNTRPAKQIGPYKGPIASNTVLTLTLAGTNGIPSNATGVMGNLTAADATGSCFLALVPSGANHLGVSSINFPAQAPGTGLANAFTVGLSSDGKIDIYTGNCGNYTVNIIMDITGFII